MLLFADSKHELWTWRQAIVSRLARLRLTLHPGAHPRPVGEGIPFLGFVIYRDSRRLKRRKVVHFQRALKRLVEACAEGRVDRDAVRASIRGWVNHARFGNTIGLRKAVLRRAVGAPPRVVTRPALRGQDDNTGRQRTAATAGLPSCLDQSFAGRPLH